MRALTTILAAILMLTGIAQEKPFTLKKDSVMSYQDTRLDENGNSVKSEITYTVKSVEGDKFTIEAKDGQAVTMMVFSYGKEFYTWNFLQNGEETPGMNVFKLGAKKGDSWDPSVTGSGGRAKMTYEDDEEVTVPAGKFMCKRLVIEAGGVVKVSFWFADKVGFVKGSKEVFGTVQAQIELQKFTEGK